MRFAAVAVVAAICMLPGAAPADEPPAALVTAVSGKTTPPLEAMSEIPSGKAVTLDAGAEVTLLDYARCKMVTVSGGTVTVTRFDFVADGKIVSEVAAPCPRVHRLSAKAGGSVAGGLVMRGVAAPPRWPLDKEFVFAGEDSNKLKGAAIYAQDRFDAPLVRLAVEGRRARLPAEAASLAVNDRYVMRLNLADRTDPVDIPFVGAAPNGQSLLVVLRGP
jgi:hypothetical protein